MIKYFVSAIIALSIFSQYAVGQTQDRLFATETPFEIRLTFSIKAVAKTKQDSIYLPNILYYREINGLDDSVKVSIKSRGNFRLQTCYFPPPWVKIDKTGRKGNVFEGNKKIKLVLPCSQESSGNTLIVKEYLCYKLYEIISPYAFRARLTNIDFTEVRNRKPRQFQLKGILVEDLEKAAKRYSAKARESSKIPALSIQDTASLRFAMFQYMISNTDLSMAYQHNTKLLQLPSGSYISMPYDFDMSGLVDAPYAVVSQVNGVQLDVQSVRDRIYRGWCRSTEITEFVRQEFIAKKVELLAEVDKLGNELTEKEMREIKTYLQQFFDIIQSDQLFHKNIREVCRALSS